METVDSTAELAQPGGRKAIVPAAEGRSTAECLDSPLQEVLRNSQINDWIGQYNGWNVQINVWSAQITSWLIQINRGMTEIIHSAIQIRSRAIEIRSPNFQISSWITEINSWIIDANGRAIQINRCAARIDPSETEGPICRLRLFLSATAEPFPAILGRTVASVARA